jgi:uncharacterized protein YecE (DUF72 family)
VDLARRFGVAIVFADSDDYPALPDPTADFVYCRLQRCREDEPAGYPTADLDAWAQRMKAWASGNVPPDLELVGPKPKAEARDVFAFFIAGDKVRAPAAAVAMLERL